MARDVGQASSLPVLGASCPKILECRDKGTRTRGWKPLEPAGEDACPTAPDILPRLNREGRLADSGQHRYESSGSESGMIFGYRLNLWQGEEETGAVTQLALDPDFAAVRLHDVFDDGKAEAGAARLARARAVYAVKSLEDAVLRLGGNSGAVVLDPELDLLARDRFSADAHTAFVPAIFDGVLDQVEQDLLQPVGVGARAQARRQAIFHGHFFFGRPGLQVVHHAGHFLAQVHRVEIHHDLAALQARNGQQILDQIGEAVGGFVDGLQEAGGEFRIVFGPFEQGLDEPLDERERRAQFMADVGDEFLAGLLQLLEAGQFLEDQDRSAALSLLVKNRRGVDSQPTNVRAAPGQLEAVDGALAVEPLHESS